MAQPPEPQQSRSKWIWIALIVVFTLLILTVIFNPSGDREGSVEDPIEMNDPGTGTGLGQTPDPGEDTGPAPEPFAPGGETTD